MLKCRCVPDKEREYKIVATGTVTKAVVSCCCCCSINAIRFEPKPPGYQPAVSRTELVFPEAQALHSQLIHTRVYSQNRFSNSLNSFGLISSLLMPSISINTPWRA